MALESLILKTSKGFVCDFTGRMWLALVMHWLTKLLDLHTGVWQRMTVEASINRVRAGIDSRLRQR